MILSQRDDCGNVTEELLDRIISKFSSLPLFYRIVVIRFIVMQLSSFQNIIVTM